MKAAATLLVLCLLGGCANHAPFQPGDVLVSPKDGTELGTVIELRDHSFENGASGASVHVRLKTGKDAWYSIDTTVQDFVVKK